MKIIKAPAHKLPVLPEGTAIKWSCWNDEVIYNNRKIIFNTLYRSAILVDEDFCHETLQAEEQGLLQELGILVPADKEELADFEQSYIEAKCDLSYIDLTIVSSNQCQMNCAYCFEGNKPDKKLDNVTMDDIMSFLDRRKNVCKRLRVTWFGGEPLLGYSQMRRLSERIIDFCNKNHIDYSADITTNGYALTRERCNELINQMLVRRFIITVDGLQSVHDVRRPLLNGGGTFERIWHNIKLLVDAGAWVTIRMTIDCDNVNEIPAFLNSLAESELARRTGLTFCRTIDINFTSSTVRSKLFTEDEFADVEWKLMLHAHKLGLWRFCLPGSAPLGGCLRDGDIVIGTNGEIYKCLDTLGDTRWISGHISETEKADMPEWFSAWHGWLPSKSEKCGSCKLLPLCSGGCPHNALFKDKKHGAESQCPDWKPNYKRQIIEIIKENDGK